MSDDCHTWDLQRWLEYQRGLNSSQIDLGLQRLRPVAERMQLSFDNTALISVAGTNGKGSTVALLEALASAHGLSVASYSSPWLLRYNESVRLNGTAVTDEILLSAFCHVEHARGQIPLTEFEFRTLAAVQIALQSKVDVLVLEVGLGGRLDAVNLFDAEVAIVTSIALDHQQWLGTTREQIADEKIGIARSDAALVSAEVNSHELLVTRARALGAVPWRAQREYCFERSAILVAGQGTHDSQSATWRYRGNGLDFQTLPLPALAGIHQIQNAAAAITALSLLNGVQLQFEPSARAMAQVSLLGRLQTLPGSPHRMVDVAHNPHAARALASWADSHLDKPISAVCAMYADKSIDDTLIEFRDIVQSWHVAPLMSARGASAQQLVNKLPRGSHSVSVHSHASVEHAWRAACADATVGGCALGFGSFETVAAILQVDNTVNCVEP